MATRSAVPRRSAAISRQSGRSFVFLPLTRDGRLADESALDKVEQRAPSATDCFVFCHGWLHDAAEAQQQASRFFALLDTQLAALRDRVVALRVALHWPSRPFAESDGSRGCGAAAFWRGLDDPALAALLLDLCAAEVPLAPEEEVELSALARRLRDDTRGGLPFSPVDALSFWMMKRRAGDVGERFGRERWAPLWAGMSRAPRLHLIGHSFGARVVASMALGGVRPESVSLLLAAFSAFAFAREVPGSDRPGFYYRVLAEQQVRGRIAVVRSVHDRALSALYPAVTTTGQIGRAPLSSQPAIGHAPLSSRPAVSSPDRLGHAASELARSALGAVGARGVGAPELDLVDAVQTGLPDRPIVNVNASRVITARDAFIGAHRDIYHSEIATMILLTAGVLEPGPDGLRSPRITPFVVASNGPPTARVNDFRSRRPACTRSAGCQPRRTTLDPRRCR